MPFLPRLFPPLVALAVVLAGFCQPPRACAEVRAPPIHYHLRVLPNGLKVYSVLDAATPYVSVQVWYDVGAKDDPAGRSGFAHLFEHLMFKGTRDMPPEYIDRLTEDIGGANNASTDSDYTEYDEIIPANHLEQLLWAEAERMSSLVVDQANFVSERSVVEAELRQTFSSDPYGRLFEQDIPGAAFARHPYHRSPLGSVADLNAASLADVEAFHALYYRPDNANLIVAGNFDPKRLEAWVDKYFGAIARPTTPIPRVAAAEPRRTGARLVDAYAPNVPLPAVVLTYAAPTAACADAAALKVLDAILTHGDASRLNVSLVHRRHLAEQVFSDVDLRQQAGLFEVGAVVAHGRTLEQGESALRAAVQRVRVRHVTAAELQAAKNQLVTELLQDRETIDGLATAIGEAVVVKGDAAHVNTDLPALQAVTAADVQRVARAYLVDDRRITIRYRGAHGSSSALPGRAEQPTLKDAAARISQPAQMAAHLPPLGPPVPVALPRPFERTLPNGLRVIVAHTGDAPLATALLTFGGGSALDPPGKAGLSEITAELATKGAAGRSELQISASIDALGDTLSTEAADDASTFSLAGLSTSLPGGLAVLAEIVRRPTFGEVALHRLRLESAESVLESMEEPDGLVDLAVAPLVFGGGPYGHTANGLPASIARIDRTSVVGQYRRIYRPDNAVLVIAGDVDPEATFALAERVFGGWARPTHRAPQSGGSEPTPRGRTILIDLPGADQATVVVAGRSIGRLDRSYDAVEVANDVLGGDFSSRLNMEIRVKRGLTYSASSELIEVGATGLFSASAQTGNASAPEVAGLMLDQLTALRGNPPPAGELAAHQAALIGAFERAAETGAETADLLADYATHHVRLSEFDRYPERIEAVTRGEELAAATRLVDPANVDVLIVGDARQMLPGLKNRFANVEVIPVDQLRLASPSLR
jgi:zinc protease